MKGCRPLQSYFLLYTGIIVYSFCPVLSKLASGYRVLSPEFIMLYGAGLLVLAVYALLWQQVLKYLPLTTAYSNRPLVTILGMVWGSLFFHETITVNMLVGAAIILWGIWMVVKADAV